MRQPIGQKKADRRLLIGTPTRESLKQKIIEVCNTKIGQKGENVGLSFYPFFANKNDNPQLRMEAATWWLTEHKLDHFEKAAKIKKMVDG